MEAAAQTETFRPLFAAATGIDLTDPTSAVRELNARFAPDGPKAQALNDELKRLLEQGLICDRGEPPVRYSRASQADDMTFDFSIDVVHMSAPGPQHTHPNGEVNWCVALDGAPTFDGDGPGWVVKAPGTTHVPTVEGGTMLIVYLLPGGAIEFH